MGRRRRKTYTEQEQGVQQPVYAGELQEWPTAIYARLSVENSGKDDDGNSLQNQIAVCKDYLDGCPHLRLTEVYSDNGRTGTVFDRPAWNRLMDDVRRGRYSASWSAISAGSGATMWRPAVIWRRYSRRWGRGSSP